MSECFLYNRCNHKDCENEFCMRRYKLTALYDAALFSEKQRKHISIILDDKDEWDEKDQEAFHRLGNISRNILSFIEEGQNLFIHSTISGNGKTTWAIRMVESFFDKIWIKSPLECRALFISVPTLLISLKDDIHEKSDYIKYIKENITKADIVIWDDIAAKTGTEYEVNNLLSLIDTRITLGKTNIFTSNLNKDEMMKALGSRLTSRICNLSVDIELVGSDKRALVQERRY